MANKYLTTTLPYVNADPHVGFAYELVAADALVRYWKATGDDVFFNTGTDEHGQKIAGKADEKGESRQAYVDHYANEFRKLIPALGVSEDIHFIRTTDERHKKAAEELWRRCEAAGDIYKKKYKGLYCVGDEMFVKESELVDGRCANHPNLELEEIEEENYFFKLSNYQSYLEEYLSRDGVIVPEWRRQEARSFVKKGLEDFSISREKARLDWGIPVPGDENQVMYVWFDALTNYVSTLGWPEDTEGNYEKFWKSGEPMQIAGKDQVRFQSVMWQAMLKSAGLAPTAKVLYHGFITSGGQKMSKSLGNVVSPFELVSRYGTEATRYLLLRHVHPFEDTDVTWERLDEWYNAGLVNGIGNLTARILKMSETHLGAFEAHDFISEMKGMEEYDCKSALDYLWSRIQALDEKIAETEPFKLVKTEPERAKAILEELRADLYRLSIELRPFMPATAVTIEEAVKANKKPENLFARID
ncbi:MAG TPA: methionine--tRNA ligase [Candidatus Paceibacterota bacterium]|nr:methionine--tRNA ligase [Candidatus Paceibacterota bacterium]